MARTLTINIFRFVVLILMQVFLFKNISYYNMASPFPYILFILLLPVRISNLLLFSLSVLCGLTVDMFYNTLGLHIAACVALAWARINFMNLTLHYEDHDAMTTPGIGPMSTQWFLIYVFILTFIHHLVLLFLEVFSLSNLLLTLSSIFFSCIFTLSIILLFEFALYNKKRR